MRRRCIDARLPPVVGFAIVMLSLLAERPAAAACVGGSPNGWLQTGEECDGTLFDPARRCGDGGASCPRPDRCRDDCTFSRTEGSCNPLCGNGCLQPGEVCDDGGGNSDVAPDACRTDCRAAYCGDEVVDSGEACDDGPWNSDYTPDRCREDCSLPLCGDGVVDVGRGEQCDLGPLNSDAVGSACTTRCIAPDCGNGLVDPGETCDDGNEIDEDACTNACRPNVCGDGLVDRSTTGTPPAAVEACDDGNELDGDDCSYDCNADLRLCGNDRLERGEECDDGTINSDLPDAGCRTDCRLPRCGDGITDPGGDPPEECDGDEGCGPGCARAR
ncbi:MAG: hypothetical protein JXB32_20720 [Deltaproteobacteria bacterium]|nr:hypothetical protein [Deltaproteobacteria bacterium]